MQLLKQYFGKETRRDKRFILLIILFVALITSGFSISYWPVFFKRVYQVIYVLFAIYMLVHKRYGSKMNFEKLVMFIAFIPCVSMINSLNYFGQPFIWSFITMSSNFVIGTYFLLHKWRIKEVTILRAFLCLAIFSVSVQIIQQFTYPHVLFGVRPEDDVIDGEYAEMRNGLWRFRMFTGTVPPILFAMWIWLRKKFTTNLMLWNILFMASIYLTLTRQVMFAFILTIFVSSFIAKKHINRTALFLGALFILGLYVYYDVLFSSLAEKTSDELEGNIRIYSATYFWNESIKTPFTFLFGYGRPTERSIYWLQYLKLVDRGFYSNDVGFIGEIYEWGVLYVIACYVLLYRLFFTHKTQIPMYIRLYTLYVTIMSPMIFPVYSVTSMFIWGSLLYIADLHINRSPLALKATNPS